MVADVLRFESGAGPVKDRDALEGDEAANLFAAGEPGDLGGRMQRVDVGDRQPLAIRRCIEEIRGQPHVRQAGCDRRENGRAVEALQRLEACLAQGFDQGRHRWLAGPDGVGVSGHLRQELTEAGFGQPLRAKEPYPADLLAGQPAIARLAPNDFGMPMNRRRDRLDREEVGQLHGERYGRLCDATLHCSLQRRKPLLPTS